MTYRPVRTPTGAVLQSSLPKTRRNLSAGKANGLLLRGAVVVTYEIDNPTHPEADLDNRFNRTSVYCDCVVITNIPGSRWLFLPRVLVSQDRGGMHSGRVWKPRAASIDITGATIDANVGTNPANLDGDHVLIGFLNDNLAEPVILKGLPHPAADIGQENEQVGHRLLLKAVDGDPDYWRHRGATYGISDGGDFVADLRQAYAADLGPDGKLPAPPGGGAAGNFHIKLPDGSVVRVEIDGITEYSVAVAEHLQTLYSSVKSAHDGHKHPTGTGPSGIPDTLFPSWDPAIVSDRVKIPDTGP